MKPNKVKQPKAKAVFASVQLAVGELLPTLANVLEAEGEKANVNALIAAARDQTQSVINQIVASGFKVGKSPRGNSDEAFMRRSLHEFFHEQRDLSPQSRANAVSAVAKCINGYETTHRDKKTGAVKSVTSHTFRGLNPARYVASNNGEGGREALIQKSDSAYSINAKRNDSPERLAQAVQQFGAWLMSVIPADTPADDPRVRLAAYLKDVVSETQE